MGITLPGIVSKSPYPRAPHFPGGPGRDPLLREISTQFEKVPPAGPRAAPSSAAGVGELDPARYRICLFGNFGEIYPLWVKVGLVL